MGNFQVPDCVKPPFQVPSLAGSAVRWASAKNVCPSAPPRAHAICLAPRRLRARPLAGRRLGSHAAHGLQDMERRPRHHQQLLLAGARRRSGDVSPEGFERLAFQPAARRTTAASTSSANLQCEPPTRASIASAESASKKSLGVRIPPAPGGTGLATCLSSTSATRESARTTAGSSAAPGDISHGPRRFRTTALASTLRTAHLW